jgi:hypothetical protein
MDWDLHKQWLAVVKKLEERFGSDLDEQAILFLIGVQELGKGKQNFTKDQKIDVLHIAICTLLAPYGYYEYEGIDTEGWPHWKPTAKLPHLKPMQQSALIKEAIVEYFKNREQVN